MIMHGSLSSIEFYIDSIETMVGPNYSSLIFLRNRSPGGA